MTLMVFMPHAAASCITLWPTPLLDPFWMIQSPTHPKHTIIFMNGGGWGSTWFQRNKVFHHSVRSCWVDRDGGCNIQRDLVANLHEMLAISNQCSPPCTLVGGSRILTAGAIFPTALTYSSYLAQGRPPRPNPPPGRSSPRHPLS